MKLTLKSLVIHIFILLSYNVNAQELTQTIRGQVVDKDSETPLIGATIAVMNIEPIIGTISDNEGYFVLENIPIGRRTLKVNYLGYQELQIPEVMVGSGKEVILNIKLQESLIKVEEVNVVYKRPKDKPINEMAAISSRAFTVEETSRYAGSIDDPSRMAMSFAGVTLGGEDARNDIVIRGNSPRGMLWQIQGIPVPTPNHFSEEGSSGGGVCVLSNNTLDNSDFYTGAWSAGYGNALSGVFDIKLRKGNSQKREYAAQVGFLGVDFAAEGPFSSNSRASYLINYRYSTLAIFEAMGINIIGEDEGTPEYQDLTLNFFIPTKKAGIFNLWAIGGLSELSTATTQNRGILQNGTEFNYISNEGEILKSDIGIVGLSHKYFLNNRTYIETKLSASRHEKYYSEDGRLEPSKPISKIGKEFEEDYNYNTLHASMLFNSKLNKKLTLRGGANISYQDYDAKNNDYDYYHEKMIENVNKKGNNSLIQAYLQSKYTISDNFNVFSGIHFSTNTLNNKSTIEPRVALKWKLNQGQSFTLGYGLHSQLQPLPLYLVELEYEENKKEKVNKNLDFSKAHHIALAYDNMLTEKLRLKVELYYQKLYGIPIARDTIGNGYRKSYSSLNDANNLAYFALVNEGSGENYGVELTLEKFLSYQWYFLLTASLYESKYKGADDVERNTKFNGNYNFNFLVGKEFKIRENNILSINTKIVYTGGKRDHPIVGELPLFDDEGNQVFDYYGRPVIITPTDYSKAFEKKMDDYFRVDLGIQYRINRPKTSHIISADIQNVFDKENIYELDGYNAYSHEYTYDKQAGIIPVLKYRIEF